LKTKGLSPEFIKDKKYYQKILTLLQVHPCYIVKILQAKDHHGNHRFSLEDRKLLLKQLFTSNKRTGVLRNNYLLISIFEIMLPWELSRTGKDKDNKDVTTWNGLEQVDLTYDEAEAKKDKEKGVKEKEPAPDALPKTEMISTYIFKLIFKSQ